MIERYTDDARKVMQLANRSAQKYNHEYIGTEDILFGLIELDRGDWIEILNKGFDVKPESLKVDLEKLIQPGPDMVTMGKLPQTPRAKMILEYAMDCSRELQINYVGTDQLMYGVIKEAEGIGGQVLSNNGVRLNHYFNVLKNKIDNDKDEPKVIVDLKDRPNYWKIPRDSMTLSKVLGLYDFRVRQVDEDRFDISPNSSLDKIVGFINRREGRVDEVTINYIPEDMKQMTIAFIFKEVLKLNEVTYLEQPSSDLILKNLESSIEDTTFLIDRLKGKQ